MILVLAEVVNQRRFWVGRKGGSKF